MPDWNQLLGEIQASGSVHDLIRRKYLRKLHELTNRNIIIYYSGWLQKRNLVGVEVNDADKNGLMTVVHELDRSIGLDLILHTPGGETSATESLVDYLRSMFGNNIRAFIPQLALSAGTMIACACKEIIMGKQSSLGPIDPQFRGIPAHGVVEEFKRAKDEIKKDPSTIPVWQPILAKYSPAFIGECEKAIDWANEMVTEWLLTGMFSGHRTKKKKEKAKKIVTSLTDHALSKSHARHLSYDTCKKIGLKVRLLEDEQDLQDAILSVHHTCIHTLGATDAFKIIENHDGKAFIQVARQVIVKGQ
jgi:ATP-dependent protease ClpP protease subunit